MVDRVGVHRVDDTEIVRHLGQMRQQLAHPDAVLALAMELEHGRRDQLRLAFGHRGHALPHADALGQRLFEQFPEVRLVVEQIDLTWRTGHEQEDDVLGPRRAIAGRLGHAVLRQQRGQRGHPQAHARGLQELPPSLQSIVLFE